MRFLSRRAGASPRLVAIGVLVAAVALGGAVKVGSAASTKVSAQIVVLNDSSPLILGTATPGGNMGYDLAIANTGTTLIKRLVFSDTIGPNGIVVYVNTGDPAARCTGLGTATLTCVRENLKAGAGFHVTVLFKTDPNAQPGDPLVNTLSGTISIVPNPGPGDAFSASATRSYSGASGSIVQSFALPGETLAAGGTGQTSKVTMPGSFVNSNAFVGTTLQNLSGPAAEPPSVCGDCLAFETRITIPTSTVFGTTGPFFNGTTAVPFTWTLRLPGSLHPPPFVAHGVWHADGNGNVVKLPNCARDALNNPLPLTTSPGICVSSLTQAPVTDDFVATGLGLTNGSYWIG